jgi:DNA-binding NarL/FixJ family response regulator
MQPAALRTVIADDHPLFRDALRQALTPIVGPQSTILEAGSMAQMQACVEVAESTDLILLDLNMPGVQGFSGLLYLRTYHPELPVVIVSANEDPSVIRRAMEHGASAFIGKSTPLEEMSRAIRSVLDGEIWMPAAAMDGDRVPLTRDEGDIARRMSELTPQQFRVLMMIAEGRLNKQIAFDLEISEATVKAHVTAILRKLGVSTRTQAVLAIGRLAVEPADPVRSNPVG